MLKAFRYCNIFIIIPSKMIFKNLNTLPCVTVHFSISSFFDSLTSHRKNSLILQGNQKYTYRSGIIQSASSKRWSRRLSTVSNDSVIHTHARQAHDKNIQAPTCMSHATSYSPTLFVPSWA